MAWAKKKSSQFDHKQTPDQKMAEQFKYIFESSRGLCGLIYYHSE